ncbi:MAG: hypothetical protein EOP80_03010 [Variovorax sp.]|nr:MAG: hypothetical protein EOP80_03010 [Variovorax sp.]
MQPVLELTKLKNLSFTYSVRAPRAGGVIPPPSYVNGGMASLAACLHDAAQALSPNFSRIYVRYQGICVGELDVSTMLAHPMKTADALVVEYLQRGVALPLNEPG